MRLFLSRIKDDVSEPDEAKLWETGILYIHRDMLRAPHPREHREMAVCVFTVT